MIRVKPVEWVSLHEQDYDVTPDGEMNTPAWALRRRSISGRLLSHYTDLKYAVRRH